jgi:hypothetical protein
MLAASTNMTIALQEHLFYVLYNIHPVFAYVVQAPNKRRHSAGAKATALPMPRQPLVTSATPFQFRHAAS